MASLRLAVLFVLVIFATYSLSEESSSTERSKDVPDDEISADRISKREVQSAEETYDRLESSFISLTEERSRQHDRPGRPGRPERPGRPGRPRSALRKIDIVFVLDKSGSIGRKNFILEKEFVQSLIEYFPIFPAKTRVAVVTYSTRVKLEFNFKKYINKACLRKGILKIKYTGGATATGSALQYVRNNLIFSAAAGARNGAKKVVFVLTDGRSNGRIKPSVPAGQLKASGVIMFALGVTNNMRESELLSIATSPARMFHVGSYTVLHDVTNMFSEGLSRNCYNGRIVYDECGRRCRCRYGKLVKCCRLRKEFTDMNYTERVRYINTVKTASTDPAYKPRYDTLLTLHKTIIFGNNRIHVLQYFLPWHRWFILQYENLLREIDCRVTVPYWDWSLVGADPFSSSFWNTGAGGFGENGIPGGSCVNTGPFKVGWSLPASAGGGCLTRDFAGTAPDAIAVQNLISSNANPADLVNFEDVLRVQFHDEVHCIIDGTMCSTDAATAPEFFLHHAFVDKIWWNWQQQSNDTKFHSSFMSQPGLMSSTPYPSKALMDLNNQPDCVCAEYIDPQNNAYKRINASSSAQLKNVARLPLPPLSSKAAKLFRTSPADLRKVRKLVAEIQPRRAVSKSALRGADAKLGFKLSQVRPRDRRIIGEKNWNWQKEAIWEKEFDLDEEAIWEKALELAKESRGSRDHL